MERESFTIGISAKTVSCGSAILTGVSETRLVTVVLEEKAVGDTPTFIGRESGAWEYITGVSSPGLACEVFWGFVWYRCF